MRLRRAVRTLGGHKQSTGRSVQRACLNFDFDSRYGGGNSSMMGSDIYDGLLNHVAPCVDFYK